MQLLRQLIPPFALAWVLIGFNLAGCAGAPVQEMSNALVGHAIRQSEGEGNAVSCKAGCWACCRQLIPVTEGEARYLAELVAGMPEPRRSELRQRFNDTIEILREKDLLDPLRHPGQPGGRSLHDLGQFPP